MNVSQMHRLDGSVKNGEGRNCWWVQMLPLLTACCSGALLFYVAGSTSVWDDEVNGYYLSRQPLASILQLMAENFHEDPPLYDLILWAWIKVAGYDQLMLRGLSIIFWLLCLCGIREVGATLKGPRAGSLAMVIAALMPIHLLFPCSMRWYSLFACLSIWNFYFFVVAACGDQKRTHLVYLAGYVVTGAAMWYTNYSAPAVFLGHGLIVISHMRSMLPAITACWAIIGLLYMPWLFVFIKQLALEDPPAALQDIAASLYATVAGELSTPFAWHISVPALVLALISTCLILYRWRECRLPAFMALELLVLLLATRVMIPKRVMIITPYLAVALGIAMQPLCQSNQRLVRRLQQGWIVCSALLLVPSGWNFATRDGWLSYRWLVPFRGVVGGVLDDSRGAPRELVMTNSNVACFYARDAVGLNIAVRFPERISMMPLFPLREDFDDRAKAILDIRLLEADRVVYVHENASTPYSRVGGWLEPELRERGFELESVRRYTPLADVYVRWHPDSNLVPGGNDRYRLLVCTFQRKTPE